MSDESEDLKAAREAFIAILKDDSWLTWMLGQLWLCYVHRDLAKARAEMDVKAPWPSDVPRETVH